MNRPFPLVGLVLMAISLAMLVYMIVVVIKEWFMVKVLAILLLYGGMVYGAWQVDGRLGALFLLVPVVVMSGVKAKDERQAR